METIHFIQNFWEVAEMSKASDVIVIGAGVVGCAAAYYLAKGSSVKAYLNYRSAGKLPAAHPGAMAAEPDSPDVTTVSFLWPCLG